MEKKACRIGKFNVVDMIAVVLILLVVALAGWKLLGDDEPTEAPGPIGEKIELTYVVRAERVAAEIYETAKEQLPAQMSAGGKMVEGHVTAVEKKPYLVLSADGQWVEDPDHVNLYFTIVTETEVEEVMSNKVGTQEVRVGKAHILKTQYLELANTVIVDAKWGE